LQPGNPVGDRHPWRNALGLPAADPLGGRYIELAAALKILFWIVRRFGFHWAILSFHAYVASARPHLLRSASIPSRSIELMRL
jgi:hypothetical protein